VSDKLLRKAQPDISCHPVTRHPFLLDADDPVSASNSHCGGGGTLSFGFAASFPATSSGSALAGRAAHQRTPILDRK